MKLAFKVQHCENKKKTHFFLSEWIGELGKAGETTKIVRFNSIKFRLLIYSYPSTITEGIV